MCKGNGSSDVQQEICQENNHRAIKQSSATSQCQQSGCCPRCLPHYAPPSSAQQANESSLTCWHVRAERISQSDVGFPINSSSYGVSSDGHTHPSKMSQSTTVFAQSLQTHVTMISKSKACQDQPYVDATLLTQGDTNATMRAVARCYVALELSGRERQRFQACRL